MNTDSFLNDYVRRSRDIIKNDLTGIYLHGSAAMDCFNPEKSDIDLIVVVENPLSDAIRKEYMDMVVEMNAAGPAKGVEMSIVTRNKCNPFVYPTPFELHFSERHLEWYRRDPDDYIRKMNGTDKDLAAHFTVICMRGKCLYGVPITDVFSDIPEKDYIDSLWCDVADAKNEIADNPMYFILNLARVLAYLKNGLILSKMEGGGWGLVSLPHKFHDLLRSALNEYLENAVPAYDLNTVQEYASYMLEQIKKYLPNLSA